MQTPALTPREKQIAVLLLNGEKRAAIAATLKINVNTVDFHLGNIGDKLKAHGVVCIALACERLNGALRK